MINASSRDQILSAVRAALPGEKGGDMRGISDYDANLIPERTRGQAIDLQALFVEMAEAVKATVTTVVTAAAVPQAIAEYLAEHNLPTNIAMAPDKRLDRIPWDRMPMLHFRRSAATESDLVSVTGTFAAIAETGTLMMASDPERPNTLNFLPDNNIVVLSSRDIVATYEDAWIRLRGAAVSPEMPRTVALVTGPSRTSDIELVPTLGAHGPRRLHIVIISSNAAEDS